VQRATSEKRKLHYAWVVADVTFLILLVTAGIRATPSILIVPLEHEPVGLPRLSPAPSL
jgi:hypothetical protein